MEKHRFWSESRTGFKVQVANPHQKLWEYPKLIIIIILILIARDENAGAKVCGDLSNELNVTNIKYHQLDITSQESINKLRDHVMEKFGGLDVLINNSGVLIEVIKKLDDIHTQYFPCTDFLKTLTAGRK